VTAVRVAEPSPRRRCDSDLAARAFPDVVVTATSPRERSPTSL
jgi:hypothetical protein